VGISSCCRRKKSRGYCGERNEDDGFNRLPADFHFFSIGFGIWLFVLPPGRGYTGRPIESVCWSTLAAGLAFQGSAIVAGFARDIQSEETDAIYH
jgi:hypothetical protein